MSHIDQRRHEISRSHQSPEYWFAQNHRKNCYCFLYQLIGEDRLDTNSWHTEALQSKEKSLARVGFEPAYPAHEPNAYTTAPQDSSAIYCDFVLLPSK